MIVATRYLLALALGALIGLVKVIHDERRR